MVADSTLTNQNTKKIAIFMEKRKTWVQLLDIAHSPKLSGAIVHARNVISILVMQKQAKL